jgi:hypothetical protein
MRMLTGLMVVTMCITLSLISGGCTGSMVHSTAESSNLKYETVTFGDTLEAAEKIEAPNSAKEWAELGTTLSVKAKHQAAAKVFSKAADLPTPDGRFRRACLAAAASEFILAGDYSGFRQTMGILKQELPQHESLNPSPELEVLLILDSYKKGEDLIQKLDRLSGQAKKTTKWGK